MKKHQLATLVWLIAALSAAGQTLVDVRTQTKNVDFSGAASTIPAKSGSAVPASCKLGEMFFNTSNAPGQNLYLCAPANTWTLLVGGGSGSTVGTVLSASSGQFAYYAANGSTVTGHTLVAGDIPSLNYQTPLTFTGNGAKTVSSTGTPTSNNCAKWDANGNVVDAGAPCGSGSGGTSAFSGLSGGTNTSAAMLIGSGASLAATGSGTIAATSVPASGVSGLAASATTDTTNASNIASGTLAAARLPASVVTTSSASGTGSKYASTTAAGTSNNCAKWDANGNVVDAGVPCSSASGTSATVLQSATHIAHGDSITMGYLANGVAGATSLANAYDSLLATDERANLQALGQIGYSACDLGAKYVFTNDALLTPDNNPIYTLLIGTNDANNKGTAAGYEANVYKPCHQALIAWDALANKFPATDVAHGGICTNSGTWSYNTGGGGYPNWIVNNDYTSTNGSAKTCPITTYGGPIYFWYFVQDSHTTATFTYAVDGGAATSLNGFTTPAIAPPNSGITYGWQLGRIPVSAGAHSVVFTATGPTSANSAIGILAVGTPPAQTFYGGPKVYVGGIPRTNGDTSSSIFAAYNTDAQADVNLLAGDGLGVYFVNVRNYLCTSVVSGQCYGWQGAADMNNSSVDPAQLHPNPQGHLELKQAFEAAMQFTPYVAPYTGNGGKTVTSTGTNVSGDCAKWDANGNVVDAGSPCGTGGSGTTGTVNSGTANQFAYYTAAGTAVSGHTLVAADIPALSYDAAGAAAAVQSNSLQKSNNLSDLASAATARTNLGISFTGAGGKTVTGTGAGVSGNCAKWDASGNVVDAGASCGTSSMVYPGAGVPVSTGTAWTTSIPTANVVQTNQSNTFSAGTQDLSGAAHTLPMVKGLTAAKPATCSVGELYFATDATAGQNIYECGSLNTWTQQQGGGGSGGTVNTGVAGNLAYYPSNGTAVADAGVPLNTQCVLTGYTVTASNLTGLTPVSAPVYTIPSLSVASNQRICFLDIRPTTAFAATGASAYTVRVQSNGGTPVVFSPNQDISAVSASTFWSDAGSMADRANAGIQAAFQFTGATALPYAGSVNIVIGVRTMPAGF